MKKEQPRNKLKEIETALEKMSCSLASISGVLDKIYEELMKEKKEEERLQDEAIKKERVQ